MLRSFYYLDEKKVDDFLSAVEGDITNETIVEKTKTEKEAGAEGGIQIFSAKGTIASTNETEKTIQKGSSYPAKFQRMLDFLGDEVEFYQSCNDELMVKNMQRNSVLELEGNIRFTKVDEIMSGLKRFLPFLGLIQSTGTDAGIDENTINGIKLIDGLSAGNKTKGLPVVLEFDDEHKLSVILHLDESFLKVQPESIPSPVTVFCKVQKFIKKSEKYELLNLLPALESFATNRDQRRDMKKRIDEFPKEIRDVIKGPAIVVTPIAIYN